MDTTLVIGNRLRVRAEGHIVSVVQFLLHFLDLLAFKQKFIDQVYQTCLVVLEPQNSHVLVDPWLLKVRFLPTHDKVKRKRLRELKINSHLLFI